MSDHTATRRFVGVRFAPGGRIYTYHLDGTDPVRPGDTARIDGRSDAEIVDVRTDKPPFETKPVAGIEPRPDRRDEEETGHV